MPLTLQVVTSRGVALREEGLDSIVVRRREDDHVPGSEIAICRHHANLLMQTQRSSVRLTRGAETWTVDSDAGVLEVRGDEVTLAVTGDS